MSIFNSHIAQVKYHLRSALGNGSVFLCVGLGLSSKRTNLRFGQLLDLDLVGIWARIPPDVAIMDFQYSSFRHNEQGCDTKRNSFRDLQCTLIEASAGSIPIPSTRYLSTFGYRYRIDTFSK